VGANMSQIAVVNNPTSVSYTSPRNPRELNRPILFFQKLELFASYIFATENVGL